MVSTRRSASVESGDLSESGQPKGKGNSKQAPQRPAKSVTAKDLSALPPVPKGAKSERVQCKGPIKERTRPKRKPKSPTPELTTADKRRITRQKNAAEKRDREREEKKKKKMARAKPASAAIQPAPATKKTAAGTATPPKPAATKKPAAATPPKAAAKKAPAAKKAAAKSAPAKAKPSKVTKQKRPTKKERERASHYRALLENVAVLMRDDDKGALTVAIDSLDRVNDFLQSLVETEEAGSKGEGEGEGNGSEEDEPPRKVGGRKAGRPKKNVVVDDEESEGEK